jgi:hypothetical protein
LSIQDREPARRSSHAREQVTASAKFLQGCEVLHIAISKSGLIPVQRHSSFQELIMTELSNSRTTNRFAGRLFPRALIAGGLLVAALIGATFVTPQSGLAHKASVDSSRSAAAPAMETMKIVPADVLGTGVASWSPLTGDGSN